MKKIDEWKRFFEKRGVIPELIENYLDQIARLNKSGAPIIFEVEHLSLLIGIKYDTLLKMIHGGSSFYRKFTIKKKSGGDRVIEAPYPSLMQCQNWIYENILLKCEVHPSAHGYVRGKSIFTNASPHLNRSSLLKMDFENFFPSIKIGWVVSFFSRLGYSKKVSFALASLCCNDGHLVQGAPTSPYLTNILLRRLDKKLSELAAKSDIAYTRYADDITFSAQLIPSYFPGLVASICARYALKINSNKTQLLVNKNKRVVTGLSVSGESLRITRELRRKIKQDLFYIEKYGLLSHISSQKIKDPFYLDSILGKVNFWLQAEPANEEALSYKEILLSYFSNSKVDVLLNRKSNRRSVGLLAAE